MLNCSRLKMETQPKIQQHQQQQHQQQHQQKAATNAIATATWRRDCKSHATTHKCRCRMACTTNCGMLPLQVFLILTLFVIGNLSAWQENIRPKLYVELGKDQTDFVRNLLQKHKTKNTNLSGMNNYRFSNGTVFQNHFRINKAAFKYLLDTIAPKMKQSIRSTSVSTTLKLATTLRFLAQGSYQLSVGNDFHLGLAQQTVSTILTEMLDVLETDICPLWVTFNMTEDEKAEAKLAFYEKTGFPGVIGCVDGTHIKIFAPKKEEQSIYYNRKGFFSLNAMIICDHKMRIRFLDARHAGSAHDSLIWNLSHARQILRERYDGGDRNSWLLGDAGYPLEPYLMTPYRSSQEGSAEAVFNSKHAKARNIVERTIGVLKNRFRCLLGARQLHYKREKATKIANVGSALHNICIEYGGNVLSEDVPEELSIENVENANQDENRQSIEASQIRDQIKSTFVSVH